MLKTTKKMLKAARRINVNHIVIILISLIFLLLGLMGIEKFKNAQRIKVLTAKPDVSSVPPEIQKKLNSKLSTVQPGGLARVIRKKTMPEEVRVPILLYHYVEFVKDRKDTIRQSLDIIPSVFEKQVRTLQDAGYTFLTTSELVTILNGNIDLPKKPVILTFDDGYRDFYTDVFPILKKYNIRAVAYIISDFLDKPNFMTTDQMKEIALSGLVEIGSHTLNHRWLKKGNPEMVKKEVTESKVKLEALIGRPVVSFCYPYGAFDEQAILAVHEAGYSNATTTVPGIEQALENRFFFYRLRPGVRIGETLTTYLENYSQNKTLGFQR